MKRFMMALVALAAAAACWYSPSALAGSNTAKAHTQHAAQNPNPVEETNPSQPRMHFIQSMDDEGATLGDQLRYLRGAEFRRIYLEHARHILRAQERARELSLGQEPLI